MIFKSGGEAINPHEVGYRSLGFGENPGIETTHYELMIDTKNCPILFLTKQTLLFSNAKSMIYNKALQTLKTYKIWDTRILNT
jgi:hypothetical protein